jgi:hypothetical protein
MGNILFLIGITLLLGPQRTFVFFARKNKWKGTLAFWAGVLLILMRWPLIGFGVELFGIFVLFGVRSSHSAAHSMLVALRVFLGEDHGADVIACYRSFSRLSRASRTTSRLLDLIWRADYRLRATRRARMNGRTRTYLYSWTLRLKDWPEFGRIVLYEPGTAA